MHTLTIIVDNSRPTLSWNSDSASRSVRSTRCIQQRGKTYSPCRSSWPRCSRCRTPRWGRCGGGIAVWRRARRSSDDHHHHHPPAWDGAGTCDDVTCHFLGLARERQPRRGLSFDPTQSFDHRHSVAQGTGHSAPTPGPHPTTSAASTSSSMADSVDMLPTASVPAQRASSAGGIRPSSSPMPPSTTWPEPASGPTRLRGPVSRAPSAASGSRPGLHARLARPASSGSGDASEAEDGADAQDTSDREPVIPFKALRVNGRRIVPVHRLPSSGSEVSASSSASWDDAPARAPPPYIERHVLAARTVQGMMRMVVDLVAGLVSLPTRGEMHEAEMLCPPSGSKGHSASRETVRKHATVLALRERLAALLDSPEAPQTSPPPPIWIPPAEAELFPTSAPRLSPIVPPDYPAGIDSVCGQSADTFPWQAEYAPCMFPAV